MTEYQAATRWLWSAFMVEEMPEDHEIHAALRALRIADRLMGEPSEEMIKAAWFSQYKSVGATDEEAIKLADLKYESGKHISIPAYKAMREQLLREVNHDQ